MSKAYTRFIVSTVFCFVAIGCIAYAKTEITRKSQEKPSNREIFNQALRADLSYYDNFLNNMPDCISHDDQNILKEDIKDIKSNIRHYLKTNEGLDNEGVNKNFDIGTVSQDNNLLKAKLSLLKISSKYFPAIPEPDIDLIPTSLSNLLSSSTSSTTIPLILSDTKIPKPANAPEIPEKINRIVSKESIATDDRANKVGLGDDLIHQIVIAKSIKDLKDLKKKIDTRK